MYKNKKIIAIIPARGGSKGIPKKNIVNLGGRPLIYYTIETVKKSKFVDKFLVSTDDEEIREISKKFIQQFRTNTDHGPTQIIIWVCFFYVNFLIFSVRITILKLNNKNIKK